MSQGSVCCIMTAIVETLLTLFVVVLSVGDDVSLIGMITGVMMLLLWNLEGIRPHRPGGARQSASVDY